MTSIHTRTIHGLLAAMALLVPLPALAQTAGQSTPPEQTDARPTGLPPGIAWTFNFDAGWGSFGFGNSYYNNPKGTEAENLSDQWFEGYVKPALSATYTFASSSQIYGKLSAVGERTYGSAPELYGPDISSFGPEDAFIGWRSGKSIGSGENLLDFTVGRSQYRLGHGFLLFDGASEGGSRGGYWTNARKAFEFASIGRLQPGPHKVETFYLDRDELEESDSGTRLWGANYEVALGNDSTVGVTYLKLFANKDKKPGRDGLNVFNVRAYVAPVPKTPDLSFELEYASERNGDALHSNAWTLQGAYQLSNVGWKPKLSYRYAFFQGDDPATPANENYDPLLLGFYDWGTWWQGEIAGEYFLSNSNLISHLIRAHVSPNDAVGGGIMFYNFLLDHPQALGPSVTAKDAVFETDLYVDWKVNKNVILSLVTAFANPRTAVQQLTGRTKNFAYGMVYVAYSY